MNIATYFKTLNKAEKMAFANRVGTTVGYLRAHILSIKGGFRKRPKDELIVKLVMASEGQVSLDEAIDYFLVQPVRKLAAEMHMDEHRHETQGREMEQFDTKEVIGLFL